jgi:hypothetical protein
MEKLHNIEINDYEYVCNSKGKYMDNISNKGLLIIAIIMSLFAAVAVYSFLDSSI